MPVLVHAAHRPVARALALRLVVEGGQVRATARDGVAALRAQGVFTASCDPDDEGRLEAALTRVHTLVVLLGGLGEPDADRIRHEGESAARAAAGAEVQRVVLVTLAGAHPEAADPLRRAHGRVAAAFAALPLPTIEVRTGLLGTPVTADLLLGAGLPEEERRRIVAQVAVDDLIELVVSIDQARSRATDGHLVVAADGPVRRTLEDQLALAADGAPARRLGRRVPTPGSRAALLATLAGPWWTDDPLVPDAWALFDVPVARP